MGSKNNTQGSISQVNSIEIDNIRNMVHSSSILILAIITILLIIGVIKPGLFKIFLKEFSERKYIVTASVFVCLLSGTIFFATQPVDNTYVSNNPKQVIGVVNPLKESTSNTQQTIKTEEVKVLEPIAYTKVTREDSALPAGQTKLIQAGKNGQKQFTYSITYHKDKEVSRKLIAEQITAEPTPEIVATGKQKQSGAQNQSSNRSTIDLDCRKNNEIQASGMSLKVCF